MCGASNDKVIPTPLRPTKFFNNIFQLNIFFYNARSTRSACAIKEKRNDESNVGMTVTIF